LTSSSGVLDLNSPRDPLQEILEPLGGALKLTLDSGLADRVLVAWLTMDGLHHEEHPDFRAEIDRACRSMAERHAGSKPSQIAALAPARQLYQGLGMDPTRHRPSSEALLRRLLQGKALYRLDPVVDTGNLFSLLHSLPLGLYDRALLRGDVVLRLGHEGESFAGIRKGQVNVGGRLCLADDEGAFGSPSSDSDRCRIRPATERILTLLYAPADYPRTRLRDQVEALGAAFAKWNAGRVVEMGMLGPDGGPEST
jgi:DNA/RNA-binding domain of Phe-tRNA-synthetase-like protein